MKMHKVKDKKINVLDFDDDALEILYQWAQNAIVCGTPQVQAMIPNIISEYERRRTNRVEPTRYKVKIAGMWVRKHEISRVQVCDDESKAQIFETIDWIKNFTDNDVEIIKLKD